MATDEFLARDAYRAWVRLVQRAEIAVWVLTPYMDDQVVRLLHRAGVPANQVILVTDLSPGSGPANYRKKLFALKSLVAAGVRVRTLPRLHAKVLVADGTRFAVGSQNFTGYGRRSREATVVPREPIPEEKFRSQIRAWVEEAEAVTEDDMDRLIAQLTDQIDHVETAVAELVARFEAADRPRRQRLASEREAAQRRRIAEARAAETRRREEERARHEARFAVLLARRVQSSPYVNLRGAAYGRLVDVWDQGGYFKVDSGESLTAWCGADGRSIDLTRLEFVPMILSPTGRLALVRVAQGQMSYASQAFTMGSRVTIHGEPLHVKIQFPDPASAEGVNFIATLREWEWSPSITLHMTFDLETLNLRGTETNGHGGGSSFLRLDSDELLNLGLRLVEDDAEQEAFVKHIFRRTTLTGFKGRGRTIARFLEEGRYKVDLVEAAGGIFLTARHG
ncbi:phospholipase D-like domain-containing protein [Cellulomonas edaphi]|uniref:Phospholipase D-like domain-containing protein n=1 Tax=Cellulomonas edaphi TaxID=3053468 RepID=A0ABT7S4K7_9CELL|nr:phospholipase D-like domain-containing protein [Cellulomons edaphi]MDM7829879.1 phospholipase D-like domain-containing protein [Cellulomons edaphi]